MALRQHVLDIDGRRMYQGGDRRSLDIIEMGYWGMCFKLAVGYDSHQCRDRPKKAHIGT
jgi:hypothetical protein